MAPGRDRDDRGVRQLCGPGERAGGGGAGWAGASGVWDFMILGFRGVEMGFRIWVEVFSGFGIGFGVLKFSVQVLGFLH